MRRIVPALIAVLICLSPSHVLTQTAPTSSRTRARDVSAQQLKRDLDAMKQQMQQMQEKILQQEQLIQMGPVSQQQRTDDVVCDACY